MIIGHQIARATVLVFRGIYVIRIVRPNPGRVYSGIPVHYSDKFPDFGQMTGVFVQKVCADTVDVFGLCLDRDRRLFSEGGRLVSLVCKTL